MCRGHWFKPWYGHFLNITMTLRINQDSPPDQPGSYFGLNVIAFGDAAQDIQIFDMHYPKAVVVPYQIRMTLERLDDESGKLMAEFPRSSTNQKCARGLCVPAGRLIFNYMRNLVEASRIPEAYAYMPGRLIYDDIAHMEKVYKASVSTCNAQGLIPTESRIRLDQPLNMDVTTASRVYDDVNVPLVTQIGSHMLQSKQVFPGYIRVYFGRTKAAWIVRRISSRCGPLIQSGGIGKGLDHYGVALLVGIQYGDTTPWASRRNPRSEKENTALEKKLSALNDGYLRADFPEHNCCLRALDEEADRVGREGLEDGVGGEGNHNEEEEDDHDDGSDRGGGGD
ncbi:hypothetical protein FB45DRAFT_883270 [Roridomyces roridus]|uniref:Uncharacterized protein n=1 Tax=Roridomyces roridus TaxID=1738132 RepID=A0AAD7F8A5_9AGAR|nr:hypothetical protein FB45DRAFT_883270 [Roridomyces roridus]